MKLFKVEFKAVVIVLGNDKREALINADEDRREIQDDETMEISVLEEVTINDLPDGWDAECIPYGGDGNVRIMDINPPNE